jgi:hypothetical protein
LHLAVNEINNNLAMVFSEKAPLLHNVTGSSISFTVSESQVERLLERLSARKSAPGLPTKLYKAAASILAKPITKLFNQSLTNAEVPAAWKIAAVVPIPKTSSPVSVDDIRPISLLPTVAKILELVVLQYAKPLFLKEYGCEQFGFRPGSSTTCALITLHDYITRCLDNRKVAGVQVVTYDFSKAFDRLQHDIIVNRLMECNMPGKLVSWLSSYLEDRRQYVKVGTVTSALVSVTSGVPQGSLLGPFLFSVVMGSLRIRCTDCCVVKYADDITLSMPIYKDYPNKHINEAHEQLVTWSGEVGLKLNIKKCKALVIPKSPACSGIQLHDVQFVNKITLLGVTFNASCTWTDQVDKIVKTASRRLFPLRLMKPHLDHNELKTMYCGIMRSIMEYAAPLIVGLSKTDARRIQSLQNRFHRLLCGKTCKQTCLPSLEERREKQALKLYRSALNPEHVLNSILCRISKTGRFILPHIHTSRRLNTFVIKVAMLLNTST